MTDNEYDECAQCPKCGHESDPMGYWFRVGGPSCGRPAGWCCWECNTMLPSIAELQATEASIANYEGDANEFRVQYERLNDELDNERARADAAETQLRVAVDFCESIGREKGLGGAMIDAGLSDAPVEHIYEGNGLRNRAEKAEAQCLEFEESMSTCYAAVDAAISDYVGHAESDWPIVPAEAVRALGEAANAERARADAAEAALAEERTWTTGWKEQLNIEKVRAKEADAEAERRIDKAINEVEAVHAVTVDLRRQLAEARSLAEELGDALDVCGTSGDETEYPWETE